MKFLLKGKKPAVSFKQEFSTVKSDVVEDTNQMALIDLETEDFSFLKPIVYDELYKTPEVDSGLKVYRTNSLDKVSYYVIGEKNNFKILMN